MAQLADGPAPEISQRDLRTRSKAIMDAVERGQTFTVTRDGRAVGALVPLPHRRRFVPRIDFIHSSRHVPVLDPTRLRDDLAEAFDGGLSDPYVR